jgi:IS30 family transposase
VEREALYWQLLASGAGTVQACRQVGIGRKTGYRWRAEQGGIRPPVRPAATRSGRYLSRFERQRIATLATHGLSVREIARRIGRAPSTVSRELRGNLVDGQAVYDADLAHALAIERTRRPKPAKLVSDPWLREFVQDKLGQEWSPEQICGHLSTTFPDQPTRHLSPETIYQALYLPARGALHRELTRKLRTGRTLRRPHRRSDQRRSRFVAPETLIAHRPITALDRIQPGHWEGDLITGQANRSAIGTLVERTSRYCLLLHLPTDHTATAVRMALLETFQHVPPELRRTLTWDQGSEMAQHHLIAPHFADGVFFADPASPWQRATNENTNGLLRQYFRKGTDLSQHPKTELLAIQTRLNNRPRKILNWASPAQIYTSHMPS